MGKLSGPCSFFPVEQRPVDLLEKVCAHAGKKVTDGDNFSHFCCRRLQSEEEEEET